MRTAISPKEVELSYIFLSKKRGCSKERKGEKGKKYFFHKIVDYKFLNDCIFSRSLSRDISP